MAIANFSQWCKANCQKQTSSLIKQINIKLRGYYNYYGLVGNYARHLVAIGESLISLKWLNRRSQKLQLAGF